MLEGLSGSESFERAQSLHRAQLESLHEHTEQHYTAGKSSYKPFYTEHTPRRYSRSRVVDLKHIKLEISFEIEKKKLLGKAEITCIPLTEDVRSLTLDACDMKFGDISAQGLSLTSSYDGAKLRIDFDRALEADQEVTLSIPYSVTDPKAGIYFVGPDEHYPDKPFEIWTQGQDEDSRYWFPCFDYPNEKATSEIIVSVPARFNTLSNGALLSVQESGENKVFHWKHDVPHVAYLVTLVVGEYEEVKADADGIPVSYYYHPGDEEKARNSFADTPEMVKFFSKRIGVAYPYAKYSQIPATDFIFGGMENTTATTQTAFTLHDNRAHLDFSSNSLVSHELAHQWFGNLLTCRDWSHGWLNEGFTTYMECCWEEEERGKEEFQYYMLTEMESYLEEDKQSYRRALVCNRYQEPIDLFDRHLYEKGACVQHMLRFILGERLFWKAIKHYTTTNRERCVVTADWQRAIEEATGQNLDEFFDQWVFGGGHPDFKVSFSYDSDKKLAALKVQQTQKTNDLTAIFKLPVAIAFSMLDENKAKITERQEHTIKVDRSEQTFYLPLDFEPDFITFDVGNWILKTLDLSGLSEEMLMKQLLHDSDVIGRVHAARELGKKGSSRAVETLEKILGIDAPWFVHAAAAKALGAIGKSTCLEALLNHKKIEHPKARRAVIQALGEFRHDTKAADALLEVAVQGDASYFVEAEACHSLGKSRDSRAKTELIKILQNRESFNQVVQVAAIQGLVALQDLSALEEIQSAAALGKPIRLRFNALSFLGKLAALAPENQKILLRQFLEERLEEKDFFASLGTISGLTALGDPAAIPALERKERLSVDGRVKTRARKAVEALASKRTTPQQVQGLRDDLDQLKKEKHELLERLEKLESLQAS